MRLMRWRKALVGLIVFVLSIGASVPAEADHYVGYITNVWEQEIRSQYPILPPVRVVEVDEVLQPWELAFYRGIIGGQAVITLRPHTWLSRENIWHEAGHAYEHIAALKIGVGMNEIRGEYWAARGFPNTLEGAQQLYLYLKNQLGWAAAWPYDPQEAFADTFMAVHLGFAERTVTYGVPLDGPRMKVFFQSLQTRALAPLTDPIQKYVSPPFPVTTDELGNATAFVGLYGLTPGVPTVVVPLRIGLVGFEDRLPRLAGAALADATYAVVHVRGDYVRGGVIWLQVVALQSPKYVSGPFPVMTDRGGNVYWRTFFRLRYGFPSVVIPMRVGLTGVEDRLPATASNVESTESALFSVYGDYVRLGQIWLQTATLQIPGVGQPFPVRTDASGDSIVVVPLTGFVGRPAAVIPVRVGIAGVEDRFPTLAAIISPDGSYAIVHVRGDYVRNGTIWLQLVVIK